MSRRGTLCAALALVWLAACTTRGTSPPAAVEPTEPEASEGPALLLRGASVMTAFGPTLERADVLVRGRLIEAVGPDLAVPSGARVIEASGRWITPGLIDPHSHMGVYAVPSVRAHSDGNESTGPFKP